MRERIQIEDIYSETDPKKILMSYLKSIYISVHNLNYNFLGVGTGKHRVGKSIDCCLYATLLDSTFYPNMEERVVYFPEQFLDALKDLAKKNIVGGAIVWDEAGVGIPARNWYDMSNKSINFVTQVLGYLRPIVFFVTQDITYIDSQPRKLFHSFYEFYRTSTNYNVCKPYEIQYDKKKGKIYYKYPRINRVVEDVIGSLVKLTKIEVSKPPKEFIDRYEQHSFDFKARIMQTMEERVKKFELDEDIVRRHMTQGEILEDVMGNYKRYESKRSALGNVILDSNLIRFSYSIPDPLARFIKADAERLINKRQKEELEEDG